MTKPKLNELSRYKRITSRSIDPANTAIILGIPNGQTDVVIYQGAEVRDLEKEIAARGEVSAPELLNFEGDWKLPAKA